MTFAQAITQEGLEIMLPTDAIPEGKRIPSSLTGSEPEDCLWPARERFPLGRGLDVPEPDGESASDPGMRPFGLRYLTGLATGASPSTLNLTQVSYCPERQLSMLGDQPLIHARTRVEVPTEDKTRADGQTFPDKDTDYQND